MRLIAKILLSLFYIGACLLIGPLSLWVLFNARTWVGYGFAAVGIITLLLPVLFVFYKAQSHAYLKPLLLGFCALWFAIVGVLFLQTPSGDPGPNSSVSHGFSGKGHFNRFVLTNIVPELEQLNMAFSFMPYADPILTTAQAKDLAGMTTEIYREMEADDDFRALGSVMGWAYGQLVGRPFDKGHYYLYVPQNRGAEPMPALVFLHGSAGNFKAYTWILSQLAEEKGMVLIAPSYGFGSWDHAGVDVVQRALTDVQQSIALDRDQIYLAGLSNGGLGVSQVALEMDQQFRGLIFISPVMHPSIVDSRQFHALWNGRPVLVISGAEDRRVPSLYVQRRIANLAAGGVNVSSSLYAGSDHFLFFSHRERMLREVSDWLTAVAP